MLVVLLFLASVVGSINISLPLNRSKKLPADFKILDICFASFAIHWLLLCKTQTEFWPKVQI